MTQTGVSDGFLSPVRGSMAIREWYVLENWRNA